MKNHSRKEMQGLINHLRAEESKDFVCDANVKCEGWREIIENWKCMHGIPKAQEWKYCPWCGKEIK